MTARRRSDLTLLVLILLLGTASRLINIASESLWVDEGFSYWAIRHDDMLGLVLDDVHPPVYFVMLRGWAGLAGISELALRYFSLLAGLLSIAMIYALAQELARFLRREPGVVPLLAALLLALADMESYIAQQVRMYTWHVFWVIVASWALLRWLRLLERDTTRRPPGTAHLWALLVWAASLVLMLYTHYIATAALAVQGLVALLFLRGPARKIALGTLGLVGVIFTPWLLLVAGDQTANVGSGFNVPSTLESLWNWRIEWFTQQWALMIGLALLGAWVVIAGRQAAPGTGRPLAVNRPVAAGLWLLAWVVVPVAGAYLLNLQTPILMDYRLTQITPAIALLTAFGLASVPRPTQSFLIAVIVVYGVAIYDTPRPRPPWREVGQNAARYAEPGDLALAHVEPSGDWQVMYYYERFMPDVERRSIRQWKRESPETYAAGLPALIRQHDTVWYMHWSADRGVFDVLADLGYIETGRTSEDWLGNALTVYRYDVLPPAAEAAARFSNGMTLRLARQAPDALLRLDLWWSSDAPLNADYTVSAILLDAEGRLVAQHDSQPAGGTRPTTGFAPGEIVYDPHPLVLAEGIRALPPGTYTVAVKLYYRPDPADPNRIEIVPPEDAPEFAVIGEWVVP